MTNVYATKQKVDLRNMLFNLGVQALLEQGRKVERVPGSGKSSMRRTISKDGETKLVSIRTTQDTYIAFPRDRHDKSWVTLSEVDEVVAVSVDDYYNPRFAKVHIIDGKDMRERFDHAYTARRKAGHTIPLGRGVWVPLYIEDSGKAPTHVGGGAGLAYPAVKCVPLDSQDLDSSPHSQGGGGGIPGSPHSQIAATGSDEPSLTISEAKRLLGITLGVDSSQIKIIVEA
jgi:hypothetical protein